MHKNEIIRDIIDKIFKFGIVINGHPLRPYQVPFATRIIESLLKEEAAELVGEFPRQCGKSETIAWVVVALMPILPMLSEIYDLPELKKYKDGFFVGVFAPILRQAKMVFTRVRQRLGTKRAKEILQEILNQDKEPLTIEAKNGEEVLLSNMSSVVCLAANESKEGGTYHLIICDESQKIPDAVYRKTIRATGAATAATIVLIGTSYITPGFFYFAILETKGTKNYHTTNIDTVIAHYPLYRIWIDKEIKSLGRDSDEFRMNYLLQWILERGLLIDSKFLKAKNDANPLGMGIEYERVLENHKGNCVAGIDFGKDQTNTVVTVLEITGVAEIIEIDGETEVIYQKKLLNWLELYGDDYETQYFQIVEFLERYNIVKLIVDSTGHGDPIYDRLKSYLDYEVDGVKFNSSSKNILGRNMIREIQSGRIIIPCGNNTINSKEYINFINQMETCEKSYKGQFLVYHKPPGKHFKDDYVDSFALAILASKENGMNEVETAPINFFARNGGRNNFLGRGNYRERKFA